MEIAMELLKEIEITNLNKFIFNKSLTIKNLPNLCSSIETVISDEINKGVIYCIWGQHCISRETLKDGVRFSFQGCPHALALSVTTKNNSNRITIHCSTDTEIQDEDFMDSIKEFLNNWVIGIKTLSNTLSTPV